MAQNNLTDISIGEKLTLSQLVLYYSQLDIEDNLICLQKQQIKVAVAHLLLNRYFTVGPKILRKIVCIEMGSDLASSFYIFMKVDECNKEA